jgi:CheY-like chemotaxis protein
MNTNAVTSSGKKIKYETQRISLMNVATMKSPNFLNENKNENNKIKILVAEDNVSNQIVICELLKKIGYENITVAHDGVDAYTQMISIHFDIIFMDLKMPMMNGLDVTIKYNSHLKDTNAKSSIIIAVTANLSDNIKTRCFEAGMHGFIAKPINKHDLKNIMDLIKQNE